MFLTKFGMAQTKSTFSKNLLHWDMDTGWVKKCHAISNSHKINVEYDFVQGTIQMIIGKHELKWIQWILILNVISHPLDGPGTSKWAESAPILYTTICGMSDLMWSLPDLTATLGRSGLRCGLVSVSCKKDASCQVSTILFLWSHTFTWHVTFHEDSLSRCHGWSSLFESLVVSCKYLDRASVTP